MLSSHEFYNIFKFYGDNCKHLNIVCSKPPFSTGYWIVGHISIHCTNISLMRPDRMKKEVYIMFSHEFYDYKFIICKLYNPDTYLDIRYKHISIFGHDNEEDLIHELIKPLVYNKQLRMSFRYGLK
jgi:hypothetical protein